MVLQYFNERKIISLSQKVEEMVIIGRETENGYRPGVGWIHDYFVKTAQDLGLQSYRKEKIQSFDEVLHSLQNNNPVIISVERRCLSGVSLHMVVLIGFKTTENETDIEKFYYHDPAFLEEKDGANRVCTKEEMIHFWRTKAIFFSHEK